MEENKALDIDSLLRDLRELQSILREQAEIDDARGTMVGKASAAGITFCTNSTSLLLDKYGVV